MPLYSNSCIGAREWTIHRQCHFLVMSTQRCMEHKKIEHRTHPAQNPFSVILSGSPCQVGVYDEIVHFLLRLWSHYKQERWGEWLECLLVEAARLALWHAHAACRHTRLPQRQLPDGLQDVRPSRVHKIPQDVHTLSRHTPIPNKHRTLTLSCAKIQIMPWKESVCIANSEGIWKSDLFIFTEELFFSVVL